MADEEMKEEPVRTVSDKKGPPKGKETPVFLAIGIEKDVDYSKKMSNLF